MLLSVKSRQKYLKVLGFYNGKIDGKEGPKLKEAYRELQDKYFPRKIDRDGKYGNNTDILLRSAYRVKINTKNFTLPEFSCGCGGRYCTGYPTVISGRLLRNVQTLRNKYGSTNITSGLRCQRFNDSLRGSVKGSPHLKGKAVDFTNATSATLAGRRGIMSYWKKLPYAGYTYCNENGNFPNMGNAIHVQTR